MDASHSQSSRHLKSHNRVEKLFKCQHCNKEFTRKKLCIEHEREHTGEELPFECPQCSKKFNKSWSLKRHIAAVHSQARPFCCHMCPKTFKHLWHLNGHLLSSHSENQTLFPCVFCPKVFVLATSLQRHMRLAHKDQIEPSTLDQLGQENSLPDDQQFDQLLDQFTEIADMKHFIIDMVENGEPTDTVHVEVADQADPVYTDLSNMIGEGESHIERLVGDGRFPVVVETLQPISAMMAGDIKLEMDNQPNVKTEEMTQPMTVKFELGGQMFSAMSHPTERWKISMIGSDDEE